MDSLIGTSIGGYRLVQLLGSGGMGTVYLAEDAAIGQQVAIKVVRTDPDSYTDPTTAQIAAERFKQEARAVASLDHLHILPLYRYGEEKTGDGGQRAYIIMQYRPEGSLWDWLRRRAGIEPGQPSSPLSPVPSLSAVPAQLPGTWPLALDEAGEYLRQAASALHYAHERGIIHRDVKPANFLLRFEGGNTVHLLLSDFGLAKLYSSSSATSHILGTPVYMAPEQFEGAAVPESDQYGLAVMIYYFLAGRPPFEGEPMRLMHQHLTAAPPAIGMFNPSLPERVGNVLIRALAKIPADRYPSTADFAAAFAQAAQEQPATNFRPFMSLPTLAQSNRVSPYAPTVFPGQNAQQPFVPSQSAYAAQPIPAPASGGKGAINQAPTAPGLPPSSSGNAQRAFSAPLPGVMVPPQSSQPLSPPPAQPRGMGRRRALGWILGGAAVLAIGGGTGFYFYSKYRTPDHALQVLRGHNDSVTSVFWSPDGSQLVSGSRDNTAIVWQATNWQNTFTYKGHTAALLSVAWSPNGRLLVSGGEDQTVQVWNPQATMRTLANLGAAVSTLGWNIESTAIIAGTLGNGGFELPLNGTIRKSLTRVKIHALALSPDGTYLASATDIGDVTVFTTQTPRKTVFHHRFAGAALCLAWSPDGTKLAAGGANSIALVWETPGGHVLHTLPHNGAVNSIAWDPAGTNRVATAVGDGTVNIWSTGSSTPTTYSGYGPAINSVAWSSGGLASGDANNTVIIWQT